MKKIILILAIATASILADDAVATAKSTIVEQISIMKSGNLEKFKACFTDRQKERVTADKISKAKMQLSKYTIDDLVASAVAGEYKGQKTIKIKMKNGRTLTTLVHENGKWLADTIWFK